MYPVNSLRCGAGRAANCACQAIANRATLLFMTQTVPVPVWLFALILLFAAVTFASHFLFPSVRWFLRRRAEKVVARLNERLAKPIEPFKLARRTDMIQRIIYHPDIAHAVVEHAEAEGIREDVAFEKARRYAREIVPSFSATLYFGVGIRLARWLSTSLYRVRVGEFDRETYDHVDRNAAIVFVMNHRSNMDYVLVTHLVSRTSALSYAVGEWARVWPLSAMIKMMGAYFIRRRSRGLLYRRVLSRYVQLATEGGVTQAVFPEGGLSLDGRIADPKLGLLSYIMNEYDPTVRDVTFVPVALNYDRILEDAILVGAGEAGVRRFRAPLLRIALRVANHVWLRLTRQFQGYGEAVVSFGTPLTVSEWRQTSGEAQAEDLTEPLAKELMARIGRSNPVLAVPLVARVILNGARGDEIQTAAEALAGKLAKANAPMPDRQMSEIVPDALARLRRRGMIDDSNAPIPGQESLLLFYANSLEGHGIDVASAEEVSAIAE